MKNQVNNIFLNSYFYYVTILPKYLRVDYEQNRISKIKGG